MFELIYNKEGFCTRCGRYKPLNQFRMCRRCHTSDQLMRKAKNLKPVRKKRSGFGFGNWSTGQVAQFR